MMHNAASRAALAALALSLCQPALAQQQGKPARPDLAALNAETRAVAEAYFGAYVARDWDRLEPLLADNAEFQDSTAALVFGGVGREGKAAMMTLFRDGYAAITRMEFRQARVLQFGNDAIFEGDLDWAIDMGGGRIVAVRQRYPGRGRQGGPPSRLCRLPAVHRIRPRQPGGSQGRLTPAPQAIARTASSGRP